MVFLTIILFFAITLGLGFSLTRFVKESENFLERILMRIGIGLGAFIVLGLIFNLIKAPLDIRIFLAASLLLPIFYLAKNIKNLFQNFRFKFKITKYDVAILVMLLIFSATFYMYAKGAFSYPWLEDDDSWNHAIGVKYVAVEKTLFTNRTIRYIDPYPPAYDMLFGILHQSNDSLYWTLKFFNALIISLSIIFFFFFSKELMDRNKALFSTFALASVPAFLSHFIWSIALSIPMYFVVFYSLERIKHDKKWLVVSAVMIGAGLTVSPTHSTYLGIFLAIYYLVKVVVEKSFLSEYALAGLFGLISSFLLWWLPSIIRHGISDTLRGVGLRATTSIVSVSGTGDAKYTFANFFVAEKTNMINNPIGIGIVLSLIFIIALFSLIYKNYNEILKYKLKIFLVFSIIAAVVLFFLSGTYVKNVEKRGLTVSARGTVPFSEFLYDQSFFLLGLLIMIFVFVSLIVINYHNPEFNGKFAVIAMAWLIFSFYAVNAGAFYYKLSPFRTWSILSIPLAILASEGLWFLMGFFKPTILKFFILAIAVVGIILTSAYQKYTVNTAQWPPGAFWASNEEIQGYLWFKDNIPQGTNVFTFSNNALIIGFDKYICHWCEDLRDFQKNGINKTSEEIHSWLLKKGYKYLIVDGQTVRKFGINETNNMLAGLTANFNLQPVFRNNGFVILKLN